MDLAVEPGRGVHLSYAAQASEHGIAVYSVELRGQANELIYWHGNSLHLQDQITPPELTLEQGA